ncbi:helix-turn-helix domain-containing protein, partial [Nocardiopsis alba]|uniref:helix-turn-helix domain-containing protein n=1 Tax=Nocardiopsis alba TaxID=53437 RepID=UPI003F4CB56D
MAIIVDLDVQLARRGMSVGEFAKAVGITPANVAVLKNGELLWNLRGASSATVGPRVWFFLLVIYLQEVGGYSPIAAGAASLPLTLLMLT